MNNSIIPQEVRKDKPLRYGKDSFHGKVYELHEKVISELATMVIQEMIPMNK